MIKPRAASIISADKVDPNNKDQFSSTSINDATTPMGMIKSLLCAASLMGKLMPYDQDNGSRSSSVPLNILRSRRSLPSIWDDVLLDQESLEEGFAISAISNKMEIDDEATHLSIKIDL